MKKIAFIIAVTLGLSLLAGCSGSKAAQSAASPENGEEPAAGSAAGGWTLLDAESSISDDQSTVFEKATESWTGAELEPVAVIATQVVAGTNYCFLARVTTVAKTPDVHYSFVTIYADLQGNAEILDIKDIDIDIDDTDDEGESTEGLAGGWTLADPDGNTVENQEVLDKALDGFVGSALSPVACLATQVVAGTNYCFLVKEVRMTANQDSFMALVYVNQDLEGNTKIINIHTVDFMPD